MRILMRFHPRHFIARELVLDNNLRPRRHAPDFGGQIGVIELQLISNRAQMFRLDFVAIEQQRVRGLIVDNDAPVAVQNLAARRKNRRAFDSIVLGRLTVDVRVLHLQRPEARNQKNEDPDRQVLENRNFARSFLGIVAEVILIAQAFGVELLFPIALAMNECHVELPAGRCLLYCKWADAAGSAPQM